MKIIQITDLHIGSKGEDTQGVDVRQNFLNILEAVKVEQPDHLVVSGDLCYMNANLEVYEWVKGHLNALNIPYSLLSGNHDDTDTLAKAFGLEDKVKHAQLFYKKTLGNKTCLFLDTSTYYLPDIQLRWLATELDKLDEELLLFIHHPPLNAGVPFMDNKHALRNMPEVQEILFKYPHPIHIFCGHYHVDKTVAQNNLIVYITPACYFQIDYREEAFKVDHYKIGFREINLSNGAIITSVRYFDGTAF